MSATTPTANDVLKQSRAQRSEDTLRDAALGVVQTLASLKITCVLFVLALFIVLVGSLAQGRRDVWQVMDQYFRTMLAWIDVADFFPPSMFPQFIGFDWDKLGAFRMIPFPGGWTIGWLMLINLLAAHSLKFKVRVRGPRLLAGVGVIAAGLLMMTGIIVTANDQTGVEFGNYFLSPQMIWYFMLGGMFVCGAIPVALAATGGSRSSMERIVLGSIGASVLLMFAYFVVGGESARLNLSSMRILWQLIKGSACSMILLLGCNMLFEKRGGIALLHFGVAMLMFSELQVGMFADENMLSISEGEKTTWLRDIRETELAIIRPEGEKNAVVAIPQNAMAAAANGEGDEQIVSVDSLPFDVAIRDYYQNARLRPVLPSDKNIPESGLGSFAIPVRLDLVTGMDESTDTPAVYVDLIDRDNGEVLESLLVAQSVSELRGTPIAEVFSYEGTQYELYLRYKRNYRPYEVELLDVESTNYVGSSMPKDYRSTIVIRPEDAADGEKFTLWMNNPLRYNGETFYQSGYTKLPDGSEVTTLSVVNNQGWMLPYIACMLVTFGMFGQFWQTLSRYLRRLDRSKAHQPTAAQPTVLREAPEEESKNVNFAAVLVPIVVFLVFTGWVGSKARVRPPEPDEMNLVEFAEVPIAWNGRTQPVDSFARTQLLMISHKSTFQGELDPDELDEERDEIVDAFRDAFPNVKADSLAKFEGTYSDWIAEMSRLTSSSEAAVEERMREHMIYPRRSAIHWFLDVVSRPEIADRHRVIRIDDDQILSKLKLEKRHGMTFSLAEIRPNLSELEQVHQQALQLRRDKQDNAMSTLQRRVSALFETISTVDSMKNMFLNRPTDGLLEPLVDSWRILRILGDRPAVMGVPTGSEHEQRSWETVVASNSLRQLAVAMKEAGLSSLDDIPEYIENELPRQLVSDALIGSYRILKDSVEATASEEGKEFTPDMLSERASNASANVDDVFLQQVLRAIADAEPGTPPEDIVAGLTPEQTRQIATERIGASLFEIFQMLNDSPEPDSRLDTIRANLRQLAAADEDALGAAMNLELARVVIDDLQERAGHLLPGGENSETFLTNANTVAAILGSWGSQNVKVFNAGVSTYLETLNSEPLPHLNTNVLSLEAWFNHTEPFYLAICVYLPVILLTFLGWLFLPAMLRNTSLWLMVLAFLVHTGALGLRMYISGRPPVTNLYSSAIFIGWAVVLASFAVEVVMKNGLGNLLGASIGAASLTIAHYLARDGDTIGVMQAVLDTTFWLATHVVCITLGYAATFLAGFLGLMYVFSSWRNSLQADPERVAVQTARLQSLGKLVYGVLCFAIFFSLVGTVLGGLWADDSWGRFWGWDPKENGAMMIVIWNALILHARWDKMVRDYGTAVLAMCGNVVTAWSWFGVNELRAGLHTYGFTEGRLLALGGFAVIQLVIVILAITLYRKPDSQQPTHASA